MACTFLTNHAATRKSLQLADMYTVDAKEILSAADKHRLLLRQSASGQAASSSYAT